MSDSETEKSTLKCLEQKLETHRKENDKLRTRLQGYETVAKLAKDQQNEIKECKQQIEALKRENTVLKSKDGGDVVLHSSKSLMSQDAVAAEREDKTNDSVLNQGLTDLKRSNSSTHSHVGSSSFTILGRSSRDANIKDKDTPKLLSLESALSGNSRQEGERMLSYTKENTGNELSITSPEFENALENTVIVGSNNGSLSVEMPTQSTSDEYIQVFPETSQSAGSNFYVPTLESRIVGGQSCTNSSRRGPMSMIGVGNGSLQSYQYVYTGGEGENVDDANKGDTKTSTMHDAVPSTISNSTQRDLYSGTGARPKGLPAQPVREECKNASKSKDMLVKIPCEEDTQPYKINNTPMLSYGRQQSQTEISALTSFGSTLPSFSPDKEIGESGRLNNLNRREHNMRLNLQSSTTTLNTISAPTRVTGQEEFLIIEEAPPIVPPTNPIIPPVKPVADSLLLKENEDLRKKTSQLHMANKEWKNRWDTLKKQKEDENVNLQAQVRQLTLEMERMRRDMEHRIASQKEELKKMTQVKKDSDNAYLILLSGRSQEKQLLEKLKQDYGTLHQEKRSLEIQLEILEAHKTAEEPGPSEMTSITAELETELAVVKRQVTLYMDDFNREHKERLNVETKLQKERETTQQLDAKLRKTHALLKARDEDLRVKSKKAADLQYQVDDLKLKLEVEQRRSSIYPSIDPHSVHGGASIAISRAPDSPVGTGKAKNLSLNLSVPTTKQQRWACIACTYQNKMSHKQCEICGTPYAQAEDKYVELD